jgi:hypothetical protein
MKFLLGFHQLGCGSSNTKVRTETSEVCSPKVWVDCEVYNVTTFGEGAQKNYSAKEPLNYGNNRSR